MATIKLPSGRVIRACEAFAKDKSEMLKELKKYKVLGYEGDYRCLGTSKIKEMAEFSYLEASKIGQFGYDGFIYLDYDEYTLLKSYLQEGKDDET